MRWVATLGAALCLIASGGCSGSDANEASGSNATTTSSSRMSGADPAGPSGPVVTVPGLGSSADANGDVDENGTAGAGTDNITPAPDTARPPNAATDGTAGEQDEPTGSGAASETSAVTPAAPSGADPAAPPDGPPATTSPATRPPSDSALVAGVAIDLAACQGCTDVIAAAPDVNGGHSAALVTTAKSPALVSLAADGAIIGMVAVPYGTSFPPPAGHRLACDAAARCIVVAKDADGNAMLSAFHLAANGAWRDVSGSDQAFPSATPRGEAVDVDDDGRLEIAVIVSGGGQTGWMVFGWATDAFEPMGCSEESRSVPPASKLSLAACLS